MPGHLEDWNAEHGSRFKIEQRGEIVGRVYHDSARVALTETGNVVAIEVDGLFPYSVVHPAALRLSQDSHPTLGTVMFKSYSAYALCPRFLSAYCRSPDFKNILWSSRHFGNRFSSNGVSMKSSHFWNVSHMTRFTIPTQSLVNFLNSCSR